MPQVVRLVENEKYNQLTILRFSHHTVLPTGKKRAFVVCRCDCGTEKTIGLTDVRSGNTATCGDRSKHPLPPRKKKERPDSLHIGECFGQLTVLEFLGYSETPSRARVPKMKCGCECGTQVEVSLWDLKTGKTKTCGYNHPHYLDRSIPAFNQLYNHTYKGRALKQGRAFELTEDEFRALTQQDCFYCGAKPRLKVVKSGVFTSEYLYNGVDRVDNSIGYVMTNVVPCCFDCNHAKAMLSQSQFLALVQKIAAKHPTQN